MATFKFLQFIVHYGMHFLVPGIIAWYFYRPIWKKAWGVMLLTMLVDLDHLLATPIFDPTRASIGFHPLHSYYAIIFYVILLFFKQSRIVGIGLCLHMLTDFQDGLWSKFLN